ncbi:DUF308 domain-containing protein [Pseudoflavonifractor phocaeensis]|uniref:HdeD family acid-resistance protein n=1 Tax=Pseudoflavonifractor phocaeensis TaxID=1870988 RepID=UPI00195BD372|nr:DUF308 domain-containing protein [Pseudoflavonifractor phocaeensis]MBM6871057.1 DUF308 domain-containing protein [Pseudoflavonifractor phocaeensis]MBM6937206.1 DUF308 domain-containing protein [Pseudoflavonifractor phocaeensis]
MWAYLKNLKLNFILASVFYLILGVVLVVWPATSSLVLCRLLGGALLLYGLFNLVGFLVRDSGMGAFRLELFLGVVATGVGIFFLVQPKLVLSFLPIVMGVYVVMDSAVALKRTLELYRMEYPRWWLSLLLAVVGIILGLVLVLRPFSATTVFFRMVGVVFLYLGVSDFWSLWRVNALARELRKRRPIDVDPIDIS